MGVPKAELVRFTLALLNNDPALPVQAQVATRPAVRQQQARIDTRISKDMGRDSLEDATLFRVTRFRLEQKLSRDAAITAVAENQDGDPVGAMKRSRVQILAQNAQGRARVRGYVRRGWSGDVLDLPAELSKRGRRRK